MSKRKTEKQRETVSLEQLPPAIEDEVLIEVLILLQQKAKNLRVLIEREEREEYIVTADWPDTIDDGEVVYVPNPPDGDGWQQICQFNGEDDHQRTLWRRYSAAETKPTDDEGEERYRLEEYYIGGTSHVTNIGLIVLNLAAHYGRGKSKWPGLIDEDSSAGNLLDALETMSEEMAADIVRQWYENGL